MCVAVRAKTRREPGGDDDDDNDGGLLRAARVRNTDLAGSFLFSHFFFFCSHTYKTRPSVTLLSGQLPVPRSRQTSTDYVILRRAVELGAPAGSPGTTSGKRILKLRFQINARKYVYSSSSPASATLFFRVGIGFFT